MLDVYKSRQTYGKESVIKSVVIKTVIALPLLAVIAAIVYAWFFYPTPTLDVTYRELAASEARTIQLPWPSDGIAAIGAVGHGMLADDGNADKQVPIASITKLFTALAVLQQRPIAEGQSGETIIFDETDEQRYASTIAENGSSYPINAGDSMTQREALQALLIPSANNIADSLVDWAFGSEQAYLTYVADMVAEMGLEQTVITDASGMSSTSVSTPRELIIVAEAVLKDPLLAEIVRQPQLVIDPVVGGTFNTNQLLQEQFVVGVKTGTTDEAGANLVFAAEYPLTEDISETIIGVTLGQSDRETNTTVSRELLLESYSGFGFIEVVEENTVVGSYDVPWGDDVEIVSHGGITVGGWLGSSYQPEVEIEELTPIIGLGEEVGALQVTSGSRISSVPVSATGVVSEPPFLWRLFNIF